MSSLLNTLETAPSSRVPEDIDAQLAALEEFRQHKGVTAKSQRAVIDDVMKRIDFDFIELIHILNSYPAVRSASFYGPVLQPQYFHGTAEVKILVDWDNSRLRPDESRSTAPLMLANDLTLLFGRRTRVFTYERAASSMRRFGGMREILPTARTFYIAH